ncbi:MAG: LysR family transcriptional regulator [Mixta sp.]
MPKGNLDDLALFMVVVRERSFTRAAAQLGMSQSAVSHIIRGLENRLDLRLLNRTTRSVSPTEAGEQLIERIGPRFEEIEAELAALEELKDKPSGLVRITAIDHVVESLIWPRLEPILRHHPGIKVEIISDYRLNDIVAERYEIGVRRGDQVARDMIAVRMAPDQRMIIVGAPVYFQHHPVPTLPEELINHNCINLRLSTHGGLYAWELERNGNAVQVRVDGQLTFNRTQQILDAVLAGYGLAYMPDDMVISHIQAGRLVTVMEEWSAIFPGYHLYYPSRKKGSGAVSVVINALKYR